MSERIVAVENLHVRFGHVEAVRGVSFDVRRGETVALVGESGSGKSVTALSILQLLPYPFASHPAGSIRVLGEEMIGAAPEKLRAVRGAKVTMVFQEPMTSLNPLHTVARQVSEVLLVHRGLGTAAARTRSHELLELVGLRNAASKLDAYPHELSGGQRQRVMIAMALANEPELLIADEPTTALDVTIQAQILKLLAELKDRLGMALLLITHDLGIVQHMADRVCVMTQGEIVESGTSQAIFSAPSHAYTRHLLAAEPKGEPPCLDSAAPTMLQATGLNVRYSVGKGWLGGRRYFEAVKAATLEVRAGETLGIVGESGSGKTTLGLALLRLLSSRGAIVFAGHDLQAMRSRAIKPLRRDLQIVFQDPYGSLSPRLTVCEIVEEGLRVHHRGVTAPERRRRVSEVLVEVGLDPDTMDRYPHEFSGGQRQRISIARAMVLRPKVVVLDEPTSALDASVQAQIVELLRALQVRHQLAYIFISHDLKVVRALAHRILVLRDGEVVEQGPARTILDHPSCDYTRALIAAAFELRAVETVVDQ